MNFLLLHKTNFKLYEIFSSFTFIFLVQFAFSQKNIIAEGFIEVHIGMGLDKVSTVIGEPKIIKTKEEESIIWKNFGYDPENEFSFSLDFDKVQEY